jgi:hypothetical protein
MSVVIGVYYSDCTYKKAKCKGCYNQLVFGSKILSVSRAQGSFTSVSNYCGKCASAELTEVFNEISPLMQNIIKIQEVLDAENM